MEKTRQQAIAAKDKWYRTGKPCKNGHTTKRSTMDGSCYECRLLYQKNERKRLRAILNND